LELPRLVKKAMENKCWKERDGTHTFRKAAMCKWQMDDPEARVKSSLSDCTWLEGLSMDLSSRHLRTYESKRTEEHLYYFSYFYFISFSFFLFSFFSFFFLFFLLFFCSHHNFFFIFSFAPQNFCNIILT
jgi:hypothetical protein